MDNHLLWVFVVFLKVSEPQLPPMMLIGHLQEVTSVAWSPSDFTKVCFLYFELSFVPSPYKVSKKKSFLFLFFGCVLMIKLLTKFHSEKNLSIPYYKNSYD